MVGWPLELLIYKQTTGVEPVYWFRKELTDYWVRQATDFTGNSSGNPILRYIHTVLQCIEITNMLL